jgi:hypothetical protein
MLTVRDNQKIINSLFAENENEKLRRQELHTAITFGHK